MISTRDRRAVSQAKICKSNTNRSNQMTNNKQLQAAAMRAEGQPNQRDLITLLAQHFNNNQSHQLNNGSQQISLSENLALHRSNFQQTPPGGSTHLPQQYQFRVSQEAGSNRSPASSGLLSNLEPPPPTPLPTIGQAIASQLSRSHQHPTASHTYLHGPPMNSIALTCNPLLFGDGGQTLSLFNALNCFNITSDQFLLSLQQQYLLQAAAARQLESRAATGSAATNHPNNERPTNIALESPGQSKSRREEHVVTNSCPNDGRNSGASVESSGGGELLKFSINTILGRGSPSASESIEAPKPRPVGRSSVSIHRFLAEQQDRLAGAAKLLGRTHAAHDKETPDPEIHSDVDSCPSSATTPKPTGNATHDLSMKTFGGTLIPDGAQRVGCSINLTNHNQSASSSLDTPMPSSDDLVVDDRGQQNQGGHHNHQTALSFLSSSATFPWTVAARGKPRRGMMRRAVFSDTQRVGLEKRFQLQKYISKPDRKKLAEKLGLRDSQVKIWFQNRRMKWRNSKERELLSAGGSREQTLPTRNNPNPDLSDVGETIKRLVTNPNGVGAA